MIQQEPETAARRYALAKGVKYRRESFGGMVFLPDTLTTHFFNHSASWAIEQFAVPVDILATECLVGRMVHTPDVARKLIDQFFENGLVKEVSQNLDQIGRAFFTDVTDFPVDRLHAPLGVECELTLRCMRRCTYCAYESSPDIRTSDELTLDEWMGVLEQLKQCGVFYVRFTGGDPLTRPDALTILQKASDLGFGVSIASDLTVLSAEHTSELASVENLIHLQTTLDGPNPDVADSQRGPGNFRRVLRGLDLLRKFNVPVVVGTVITKLNASQVGEIAALLSQWENVVGYGVSPLYDAGRGRSLIHLVPSEDELALAYEQFAAVVAKDLVKPVDPAWNPLAATLSTENRRKLWANQPTLVRSPDRLLRIDPFGRAYTSIHVKEELGDQVYIGNVMKSDIMGLWNDSTVLTGIRGLRKHHPYFGDVVDIAKVQNIKEERHAK